MTLIFLENISSAEKQFYHLPFYQQTISAGFPSPAENEMADRIDLNALLIKHPSATFFLKVSGSSMINAGIHHQDILVVDRSLPAVDGKVVIASVDGELTVKRLKIAFKKVQLVAENDQYPSIEISEEMNLHIWGVVTHVIHAV
ncbi:MULTISPECIES: LexA family protein [Candidatus Protochlamydia]|uniref:LexA family protein n=1 Tax=Candidatus Protochlamydia TaxID=282132 RepID=UPI0005AA8CDD|nr:MULTISPECIES: translesion error-prone DNA polymerase V autoproteolytic subunit [Protochlamydia]